LSYGLNTCWNEKKIEIDDFNVYLIAIIAMKKQSNDEKSMAHNIQRRESINCTKSRGRSSGNRSLKQRIMIRAVFERIADLTLFHFI